MISFLGAKASGRRYGYRKESDPDFRNPIFETDASSALGASVAPYELTKKLKDNIGQTVTGIAQLTGTDLMVSLSCDGFLRVWSIDRGVCLRRWEAHNSRTYWLTLLSDGTVLTVSENGYMKQWNPLTGDCLKVIQQAHKGAVYRSIQMADGRVVTAGGSVTDNTLKLWDMRSGKSILTLNGHVDAVWALIQLQDGRLASGSADGTIRVWRVDGVSDETVREAKEIFHDIITTPSNLLSSTTAEEVRALVPCFKKASAQTKEAIDNAPSRMNQEVVPNEVHPSTGWDRCCSILRGHGCNGKDTRVLCLAQLKNGLLASGGDDKRIILWDLTRIPEDVAPNGTPRDNITATMKHDHWDSRQVDLSKLPYINKLFLGHTERIYTLCVLGDGVSLASGSADHTIRIWNTESGYCVTVLQGHKNIVERLVLLDDKTTIASGSLDRSIRFWSQS
jgi:WD40 repeat protein